MLCFHIPGSYPLGPRWVSFTGCTSCVASASFPFTKQLRRWDWERRQRAVVNVCGKNIYTSIYTYIYKARHIYIYIWHIALIYIYIYYCMCIYIYIYIYYCMCIYIYICTHTHIYIYRYIYNMYTNDPQICAVENQNGPEIDRGTETVKCCLAGNIQNIEPTPGHEKWSLHFTTARLS